MNQGEKTRNLLDIAEDIEMLKESVKRSDDNENIKVVLQGFEEEFDSKADNIAYLIRQRQADIDVLDAEIKRLQKRKKNFEKGLDRLKAYLLGGMNLSGRLKFKTAKNSFSTRKSRRVAFVNEDHFINDHPEYVTEKVTYAIRKVDVKNAILKEGKEVDGAYIETNTSLSLR